MQFVITVLTGNNTHTARCNGKTASCTTGEIQAAEACARKLINGPFSLKRQPEARPFYSKWLAIPITKTEVV